MALKMPKIVGLFRSFTLATALAAATIPAYAKHLPDGVRSVNQKEVLGLVNSNGDACSGSIVKQVDDSIYIVSAAHCLPKRGQHMSIVNFGKVEGSAKTSMTA